MSEEQVDYQTGEIVPVEPRPLPMVYIPNVDKAIEAWNAYQDLCKRLLDDSDYATIQGRKHRKRSGWAKLRRAFNIGMTVISERWEDLGDGNFGYFVIVRAELPDGRYEDGDGYCDSTEFEQGRLKATRHNVRSKAITRAKNRATADVIGSGEVSAEEFVYEGDHEEPAVTQRTRNQTQSGKRKSPAAPKGNGKIKRPMEPELLRKALQIKVDERGASGAMPATDKQIPFVAQKFTECFAEKPNPKSDYHAALKWLWDVDSAKELTIAQAGATLDWLLSKDGPDDTGDTPLHEHAPEEARRVLRQAVLDAGQQEMELE